MLLRITFCATAPAPATAMPMPSPPMPKAIEAAAETALIVTAVILNTPVAFYSRTKLAPSGARTTQRNPATRVETLSLSTNCHVAVTV